MPAQVSDLHEMLSAGGRGNTVPIYVDSWGIKRLATLAMRRWKAPIATLRAPSQACISMSCRENCLSLDFAVTQGSKTALLIP